MENLGVIFRAESLKRKKRMSPQDAKAIKSRVFGLLESKYNQREISEQTGIRQDEISRIISGNRWKNV